MKQVLVENRTLLQHLLARSLQDKPIVDVGTSYGSSFLLRVGWTLNQSLKKRSQWNIHIFECEWTLREHGEVIRVWDQNADLTSLANSLINQSVSRVALTSEKLVIEAQSFLFEIFFRAEALEDDKDRAIASIEFEQSWSANIQADGLMSVDIAQSVSGSDE